ncbi:MAG: valine--tRNA ligase [Candidatus Saccharimonadales bacterium]
MNLPKIYEPNRYEADIYALWEQSGAFQPQGKGTPYSIVMPPPNANGNLHLGHALGNAIQDGLIRYHRMKGERAVYVPGTDHAGFETWVVYERQLEKEGKSRFDFTRDELYQQTWDFVAKNRGNMEIQLRELGASCDWSKLVFTLDDAVVNTAYKTFKKMWDDKLIYRGERIVNYCTTHGTSFADIEVVFKNEKSYLWTIAFPLADGSDLIEIATTRPETMIGDVAVAVNPEDERYKRFIGKEIALPLTDRTIPIIADEMVDTEFGTGAVKITPAHDPNDFDVVERHPELPRFSVIGIDGLMNQNAPEKYRDMTVLEAREAILADLKELNLLTEAKEYEHSVGHCYKCGTPIQPLLKDQWFISVAPLAERAIAAIEAGEVTFHPENKGRVLVNYLKNLKDWNISRQIPWGIPIPAFQNVDDPEDWIFDERVGEESIAKGGKTYQRDPDTFDTWFSSGQWPFITTKYHDSGELAEFFPNAVMETGHDILFPWVSRMIMLSLYGEDRVPFKDVYLHGLVLDPHGQKMSKSKGNVVNPQEIMQEFGSDALRMGLITSRSAGQNQAFGGDKVIAGRNFANKLWNMARFVEQAADGQRTATNKPRPSTPADHWVVRELDAAVNQVAELLEEYRFAEAFETVYHTVWDKMADWYLEASKTALNASVMIWALETCLKIAHPFAPFVTETIWQTLDFVGTDEKLLISTAWPERAEYDPAAAQQFEQLQSIITETREVLGIVGSTDVALLTNSSQLVLENAELIRKMTKVGYIQTTDEEGGLRLTSTHEHVWLDLDQEQIQTYKETLEKKLTEVERTIEALEKRLSNESYVKNAPEALVIESREELKTKNTQAEHLRHQLKHL